MKMPIKLSVSLAIFAVASAACADVVHDAGADALDAMIGRAAEHVNPHGGKWEYMRIASPIDGTSQAAALPVDASVFGRTAAGVRAWPGMNFSSPHFLVNPFSTNLVDSTLSGTSAVAIRPRELVMLPVVTQSAGLFCPYLRFTFPRTGTYSIRSTFRALNAQGRDVGISLSTNGVQLAGYPRRLSRGGTLPEDLTFALDRAPFREGDTLAVSLFNYSDDWLAEGDASAVDLVVTEHGVTAVDVGEGVKKVGLAKTSPLMDYGTDGDGVWRLFQAPVKDDPACPADLPGLLDLANFNFIWAANIGCVGASNAGSTPLVGVCTNKVFFEEAGYSDTRNDVLPGQLYIHPSAARVVGVEYRPKRSGRYDIYLKIRYQGQQAERDGVYGFIEVDGRVAGTACAVPSTPRQTYACLRDVRLVRGAVVRFFVHANKEDGSDTTFGDFSLVRIDEADGNAWDFGEAYYANMAGSSPATEYTDATGTSWQYGYRLTTNGVFQLFDKDDVQWNSKRFHGFYKSETTYLCASVNSAAEQVVCPTLAPYNFCEERELNLHPGVGTCPAAFSVVRFKAPTRGVYAAGAQFHYAQNNGNSPNGVDAFIGVGGSCFAAGDRVYWNKDTKEEHRAVLSADDLYLDVNDPVDLTVCNHNGETGQNTTGANGMVWKISEPPDETRVHLNFLSPSGDGAYDGRGRIGWTGEHWNACPVPASDSSLTTRFLVAADGSRETRTVVTVTRDGGATIAGGTVADAAVPLLAHGIASSSPSDTHTITIGGLVPGAVYEAFFLARAADGTRAKFSFGGAVATSDSPWFHTSGGDCAKLTFVADADGAATGTFASASAGSSVTFAGLELRGAAFHDAPKGMMMIFR